jgi:hypothetical protein
VSITVRHMLFSLAAIAGMSASAAAQTLGDPNSTGDTAPLDIASAASLEAAPPAEDLIAPEDDYSPPPSVDARFTAQGSESGEDSSDVGTETIDQPPVASDIDDRMTTEETTGIGGDGGPVTNQDVYANEAYPVDPNAQYVGDDWYHEGDESFAWLISSGTWLHRGHWFSQTEATLINRSTAPRQFLTDIPLVFQGQIFFSDAMTTESAGFGYEPGLRVTVGKFLGRDGENRDRTLEFTFWGLNEWTSQHAVVAADPVNILQLFRTPLDRGIGAYNFSTGQQFAYESDLNSFEVNAKIARRLGRDRMVLKPDGHWERQCDPGKTPTFLAGFRTIHITEDFAFTAQRRAITVRNQANTADVALPAADGRYDIDAENRLFGVQVGAELYNQHCNFSWGVRGKVGGYANFAEQNTTVRVVDSFADVFESNRDERATDTQLAFGAEVGLVGTYQIRPNLAFRCAYDFMFLQGLALGPEQLDFNTAPTPNVRTGSHYFMNGGSVGLELVW